MDVSIYSKIGKFKSFKKNEIVFMQNDLGDNMYIVLKGEFGVYINSFTDFPVRVTGISCGSHFGEMSVIDGWPRSATIISEDQCTAISVDKENFIELLQTDKKLAQSILDSLIERLDSTAEMARSRGKVVPQLPDWLKSDANNDQKVNFDNMVLLAQRIRELNEVIGIKEEKNNVSVKESIVPIKLLPYWHKHINQVDNNDNYDMLTDGSCVCPYCGNGFKSKIPLFSRLEQKETTLDQRIIYNNLNMLMYTNVVCPNCNYCDTYHKFQLETRPLNKPRVTGNQFRNFENFTGYTNDYKRTLDETVLSYYLNLHCLECTPNSELLCAKVWHRLYWIYGDYNELKQKQNAAKEAVKYYVAYLDKNINELSIMDSMLLNMIISQLYMALGDLESVKKYLKINVDIEGYTEHEFARMCAERLSDL